MRIRTLVVLALMIPGLPRAAGFAAQQARPQASLPQDTYTIVRTYPHDRDAFTQGLQFLDGVFYEGTGLNGRSSIRKVRIETGEVLQKRDVPEAYFGEGITVWKNDLYELTWQSGVALTYDRATFAPKRTFKYTGEGWGLTADGQSLIMSDGTEYLRILDPATFAERKRIKVTASGAPLKNLNELEYVKGEILANVWQTDFVARIDPATGAVKSYIDFRGLLTPREAASADVLNGIAYDEAGDRLFVTGKLWPKLFEVKLAPKR
jgi:glutaminyl-peptide cyclotransferase